MYEIKKLIVDTVLGTRVIMCHRLDTNDRLVILAVMKYDEYHTKDFTYRNNDVFIDIGAHIGTWSIQLASLNPTFKVYSYEPVPESFDVLKKNISINNLGNIKAFKLALTCSTEKKMRIYYTKTPPDKFVGSPQGGSDMIVNADTISLDGILDGLDRVRILKIDCEGCEVKAFKTVKRENLNKIDYIIGEFHPWGMSREEFFTLFKGLFIDISDRYWTIESGKILQDFLFMNRRLLNENSINYV